MSDTDNLISLECQDCGHFKFKVYANADGDIQRVECWNCGSELPCFIGDDE